LSRGGVRWSKNIGAGSKVIRGPAPSERSRRGWEGLRSAGRMDGRKKDVHCHIQENSECECGSDIQHWGEERRKKKKKGGGC